MKTWLTIAFAAALQTPQVQGQEPATGQDPDPGRTALEDLRLKLEQLEQDHEDELEDLRSAIEDMEDDLADLRQGPRTTQRDNVFNPAITVFGNFLGRADDQPVFLDNDPAGEEIGDRFNLREVEFDFRAAIDPWADGVVIATFESEVAGEYEATIEEGYVTLKRLPGLDSGPGGLKLQVGRFRPEFGRFNKIHLHDLPQPTYPRALGNFLGPEGYIQNGLSGQFFLPSPGDAHVIEGTLALLNGGDLPIAASQDGSNLAGLGHLKWFSDVGPGRTLELGTSMWQSDSDHRLFGLDLSYGWIPLGGGRRRSFFVGGELYSAHLDDPGLASRPQGYYMWAQYQFDKNLYAGLRYDHSEDLDDTSVDTDTLGAYVTYYTTEFLRFRFGIEHTTSDDPILDGLDTALFELNFVFGSHPVEPYWVNR